LTQARRQGSETLTTAHKNRKNTITYNKKKLSWCWQTCATRL